MVGHTVREAGPCRPATGLPVSGNWSSNFLIQFTTLDGSERVGKDIRCAGYGTTFLRCSDDQFFTVSPLS